MGLLSIIKKQKAKDSEIRVLALGLDNAGKTTIVRRMLGEDIHTITPTMGFQISSIEHGGYTLNLWDIGGQSSLRGFWGNYYDKTNVVIWVVDCMSVERLAESYRELREKVIHEDRLVGVYLAVVINKIDLWKGHVDQLRAKVIEELGLKSTLEEGKWTVEAVSGWTGEGIDRVTAWMVDQEY